MKKVLFFLSLLLIVGNSYLFADDAELTYENTQYACTGIAESKEDPRWKNYPLKLVFTGAGRAYVAEVSVILKNSSGEVTLQTTCDAPWLVVRTKPGKYSVTATAEGGGTKRTTVTIPSSGQLERVISFPNIRTE